MRIDDSFVYQVAKSIPQSDLFDVNRNRITRQELARRFQASDRTIRKAIEKAREQGFFIVNEQDGSGYYRTFNLDELERQYKQDTARAMAILKRRKHIRKYLMDNGREVR